MKTISEEGNLLEDIADFSAAMVDLLRNARRELTIFSEQLARPLSSRRRSGRGPVGIRPREPQGAGTHSDSRQRFFGAPVSPRPRLAQRLSRPNWTERAYLGIMKNNQKT